MNWAKLNGEPEVTDIQGNKRTFEPNTSQILMNIIIPMAGMGKRMRPQTLTTPKPLLPIAGKPIVQRLVEEIVKVCDQKIEEIAFVIGRDFGKEIEQRLLGIAGDMDARGIIRYQDEALGTAHAVYCAGSSLNGNVIVAFADTLFKADFKLDSTKDGIIWVHKVSDPSSFGVVKITGENLITDFVEKPKDFVSDLAIIGIYYFRDGEILKKEIRHLLDHDIRDKGEYQLTNALENMKNKGLKFEPGKVEEWLDCGNKNSTVYTNQRILEHLMGENLLHNSLARNGSKLVEPCFIGENVRIEGSVIGPYVSIGDNTLIKNSVINNSIIQSHVKIVNAQLTNSMIGNHAVYDGLSHEVNLGDFSVVEG